MKYRAKVSSRIDPATLGIDTETEESKKLTENTDENGKVDLASVYNIAAPVSPADKTIMKYMERDGIEYTEDSYKKEYQLRAAHQIIIRGGSTAQIAQALDIPLTAAKALKRELSARQLSEIRNLNVQQEIAKALMFYDHIAAKSLMLADKKMEGNKAVSMRSQIEALRVALQAQSDKQKFLATAGAYEVGLRSGVSDNKHINDANDTRDMFNAVLSGNVYEVVEEDDEVDDGVEIL
jgi:hypothetical protein